MNAIVYGPDKPQISFKQSPNGAISFQIENKNKISFSEGIKTLSWGYTDPERPPISDPSQPQEEVLKEFQVLVAKFSALTTTPAEKKFLQDYASGCIIGAEEGLSVDAFGYPALIPQVWVNWMHYDPTDQKRAERAQKEPFRVDFMVKDEHISDNFVIFEIDGSSHFANMEAYTQHLQKDRWLRQQGWQVYRISNLEIERYRNFNLFYGDLTGRHLSIPW
jgi:hypothetical protein